MDFCYPRTVQNYIKFTDRISIYSNIKQSAILPTL